jgi:hypothetical protein
MNEETNIESQSLIQVFKKALKLFLKVFGVRILITLYQLIKNKTPLKDFLSHIFSSANMKTCLSVSLIPLLYNIFNKLISLFTKHNTAYILASFLSAFISISIHEKTTLTTYIILAIATRSIHSLFLHISKKYNIFQEQSRLLNFSIFLITVFGVVTVSHLNPDYEPLRKLYDSYNKYIDSKEESEYNLLRNITRLV